jgi:hypothetical protein
MLLTRFARIRLGFLLGAVCVTGLAAAVIGHLIPPNSVRPDIQRGTVTYVNGTGDAIAFRRDGQRSGATGYGVGLPVSWADRQGTWHDDNLRPECLVPLSSGHRIELAVLHVRPTEDAPGGPVVAWVRCL